LQSTKKKKKKKKEISYGCRDIPIVAAAAAAAFFNSPLAVCHLFVYYIEKWGWKEGSRTFFVLFLAFS
jgi:hypothetical protein